MSPNFAVQSEIIDPTRLDPLAKQRFIDELCATRAMIFDGVGKPEFTAYVVDSPAERTREPTGTDDTVGSAEGPTLRSRPAGGARAPTRGSLVGRYVILDELGAGAMGVVLAAYDPELDRKVALELLEPRGGDLETAQTRLQREAQALARLNHVNVVAVHDVGAHQGQVFVAMEFVEGQTLSSWMASGACG